MSLCGNTNSKIYEESEISVSISVKKEACPHNLAPTASTTATMALGDAMAISLLEIRGFNKND